MTITIADPDEYPLRQPDPLDRCNADCGCDEIATMVDLTTGGWYDPIYCAEHATPASVLLHSAPAT